MTEWGWDASHFDGLLSPAILARARTEGFTFFAHKIGEGLLDTEGSNDDTALAAARAAGFEFLGGYLIPRSNATVTAQVDHWIGLADQGESWWRTFPGWFWQVDLERWPYDNVAASVGVAAAQLLRARTGRQVILYASRSMYGDQLAGWDGPLWNADYVSGTGFASALYPGDGWAPGWAPYSGRAPAILQFTSSAAIAGLTTCDANAFRGSLNELRALIIITAHPNGAAAMADYSKNAEHYLWKLTTLQPDIANGELDGEAGAVHLDLVDAITEIRAAVKAQASGGVDLDVLAAKVAALMPKPPTPAEVVDEIQRRLNAASG